MNQERFEQLRAQFGDIGPSTEKAHREHWEAKKKHERRMRIAQALTPTSIFVGWWGSS